MVVYLDCDKITLMMKRCLIKKGFFVRPFGSPNIQCPIIHIVPLRYYPLCHKVQMIRYENLFHVNLIDSH